MCLFNEENTFCKTNLRIQYNALYHNLYACESWTLTAELEKRTQAFEMRCYRRLLNISYKDHVTNEEVRRKIQAAIGEYDELLTLVKKRKKKRQTEEEVGRQYQRVDRNGLCQLN